MPTGPKGQKRPADVIGNAVKVMRIATGEEEDTIIDDGKDPAAKALGANGGRKRADNMTPERRAETGKLWSMANLCEMMDAVAPKPGPRGLYKKKAA